jgi:16S rRNA (adenine1518-N6/adenine1519-N6)-dimethyltransferase
MSRASGIRLKKKFGQNFLRDDTITHHMIAAVDLNKDSSVFEIGCGDGFLTRAILEEPIARLWIFEIDPEWATYVKNKIRDERIVMHQEDFLTVDPSIFETYKPWTILANLPYNVTFPILHWLQRNRFLLKEGVIMVQEEVAQKIVKTSGRGYGFPSLFFQRFFEWKLMDKVPPSAFEPEPNVFSRLLYLKPKIDIQPITDEEQFWEFIQKCFKQPRRTLRNNFSQSHYDLSKLSDDILKKRAQQLNMQELIDVWNLIRK